MNSVLININSNLPGSAPATSISGFVSNFYSFALLVAGILAFGAIVYGGIKYAASRGNPSAESEGRSWITGALLGLLLLAGAYVVLYTVNPQLVSLQIAGLAVLPAPPPAPPSPAPPPAPTGPGTCPIPQLSPIIDPVALQMENGSSLLWSTGGRDSNVDKNLAKLQSEFQKLQAVVGAAGGRAAPNSAYRPLGYQMHLYEIYQDSEMLFANPDYANRPECAQIVATLKAEENKHGVCRTSNPCLVAAPSGCAPHVRGIGVDIGLTGVTYDSINALLQSNNIDLRWQGLPGDQVHFNLQNPPYTGCGG